MAAAKLKAVLFDMDDTLIDWSRRAQDWAEYERQHLELVFNYICRDVHPLTALDEFFQTTRELARQAWLESAHGLRAPSLGNVMNQALIALGVPADRIKIEDCLKAYDWQPVSGVAAYPDATEVLPLLTSNDIKIAIITNAYYPMWMRDRELDAFGLLGHFADCRISSADVGYLKPHPAIFEAALRCLEARPDEAVFVGDNPEADIAGAQAVGMRAVMRIGKKVPPLISGLIVPDGAINSLHELLPLLDEWYPEWRKSMEDTKATTPAGEADGSAASNPLS